MAASTDNNIHHDDSVLHKYAKFSKADSSNNNKDPLDMLILESQQKNQNLQDEKRRQVDSRASRNPQRLDEQQHDSGFSSSSSTYTRNKMSFPPTQNIDPYDPTTYGFTELGTVIGPHGVKGEMKISATTYFGEERLCPPATADAGNDGLIRHLKMPNRRSPREVLLVSGRFLQKNEKSNNDVYLIRLEGVRDRDAAKKMRGPCCTPRRTSIQEGEYLLSDRGTAGH